MTAHCACHPEEPKFLETLGLRTVGANERKTLPTLYWPTMAWEVNTSFIPVFFYYWETPRVYGYFILPNQCISQDGAKKGS